MANITPATVFPVATTPWLGAPADPVFSGTFIPTLWSAKMLEKFYATTVLGQIANTNWEGEIRNKGDKVIIRTVPSVTIKGYDADQKLDVERPSSPTIELPIDQGLYWNVVLDDVWKVQSDLNQLNLWAEDAAEQLKIVVDRDVLGLLLAGTDAANKGAAAGLISGNINLGATATPVKVVPRAPGTGEVEVVDLIVRLTQALDEQNIPQTGRWLLIPAWVASLIKRSELRDASLTGDGQSILRNGRIGMIDRFEVFVSNLLPHGVPGGLAAGEFMVCAGHKHGLTFASQLTKVETLRSESTFGTLMRGLKVYGRKVVDGKALATAVVAPA
jgi:hypothetical protein